MPKYYWIRTAIETTVETAIDTPLTPIYKFSLLFQNLVFYTIICVNLKPVIPYIRSQFYVSLWSQVMDYLDIPP